MATVDILSFLIIIWYLTYIKLALGEYTKGIICITNATVNETIIIGQAFCSFCCRTGPIGTCNN